jgi:hypothetical protein
MKMKKIPQMVLGCNPLAGKGLWKPEEQVDIPALDLLRGFRNRQLNIIFFTSRY